VLRTFGAVFFGLGLRGHEPRVGLSHPLVQLGLVFLERLARRLRLGTGPLPADLQGHVVFAGALLHHPRAPPNLLVNLVQQRQRRDELLGRRR
jgi:hypothetical protein